jgi:signal transduction histidine kinase/CheY-like chemotaxis protein
VAGEWRFMAVARDVGERLATAAELERHRHHLEELVAERTEALARSRDEAQAATHAKSEFLANMSHEIRTPMNAILGLAHLARRDANPQQLTHLDKLSGAARHLLAILNDILDFSKIEAGKLTLSSRDFDVDDMVDQACHLVCDRAMAKGLEVVQRIDPSLPTHLRGDDLRLGQVLVNLIGNAVKFTDTGHVRVNLTRTQTPDGRPLVRYEVRDTGIGMDAAQQTRIFQAFEQADSSTTRRFGGTGLGLTISRRLVELMGGVLRVESREGQGSRFWFDLPLEAAHAPTVGRRAVARFEGTHALVVDDLADARLVLTEMLEMLGLRVTAVSSGEQALHALVMAEQAGDPCLLCVLDWRMPGMDGVETGRQIRQLPLEVQPAFLMISAMGGQVPREALGDIGFSGVLVKPGSPSQLHDALSRVLRQDEVVAATPPDSGWLPDARARVLLVEDNPLNREVSAQLLEAVGLRPDLATDGLVAVEMARQSHYDLILMDVQMPQMDGLEATRQIRQMAGHANTPIVAMTANAFQDDRDNCRAAGMDDFISKPVDPADLDRALRRWLSTTPPDAEPAPFAAPPEEPLPDWARPGGIEGLDLALALRVVQGKVAMLRRLLQVFVDHHAGDAARMRAALAAGRLDELRHLLHQARGAIGTLGADALMARIQAVETGLARGLPPSAAALDGVAAALEAQIEAVRQALA